MNTYQVCALIHHDADQDAVFLFGVQAHTEYQARVLAVARVTHRNVSALAVVPILEEPNVSDAHP